MSCDDGALNTLVRNAASPRSRKRVPVGAVEQLADPSPAARDRCVGDAHVPPGLLEVPGDDRHEQDERGADRERDPPAVVAEVGEREQHHREAEAGAERQREHAGGEGARALGGVLDRGDAGDDRARCSPAPG